jgi:uncharacterized membrane protein YfcA
VNPLYIPALLVGGFLCGVVNALSGGGSFVTLPLLLWAGLPPQVANASNRVGIVLQCAAGTATYHRHHVVPWRDVPGLAITMGAGSVPGAYLASHVSERLFSHVAAVLFAVMATTVFVDPKRWTPPPSAARIPLWMYPISFLLGVYGGFLHAGVGTLQIAALVLLARYDVVRGNALKFAVAFFFSLAALVVFARAGQVRWVPGLVLAAGSILGGIAGARLVIAKGARWVRVVVVVMSISAIVELLFGRAGVARFFSSIAALVRG